MVCHLRRNLKLGPAMLVAELAEFGIVLAPSTIHRVLVRHGISRLRDLDVTGRAMRVPAVRYEHCCPGDLVHLDVKKIGRIPDGGGWRAVGRGSDGHRASRRRPRPGYAYLHTAIDDRSRLAYTEELADEKSVTAAGFWAPAAAFFAAHGIERIAAVLTDNGSCYRGKSVLGRIIATHVTAAAGFVGGTVYEVLDNADGLVEIAQWGSTEAQAGAVQQALAAGVYTPVMELIAAPLRATRIEPSPLSWARPTRRAGSHVRPVVGGRRRTDRH